MIFHSYVCLPDGIDLCQGFLILWLTMAWILYPTELKWPQRDGFGTLLVWLFRVDIEQEYQIYNHPKVGRIDFLPSSLSKIFKIVQYMFDD